MCYTVASFGCSRVDQLCTVDSDSCTADRHQNGTLTLISSESKMVVWHIHGHI